MKINFAILVCFCCFVLVFNTVRAEPDMMGGDLNFPCNSVMDCRYFGYVCRVNICQCAQWYVPDKDKRKCIGGVDQKCIYDEHCINGAYCMNQAICKCKSTAQPLENGLVCAGASNLQQQWLIRLIFLMVVVIINVFPERQT